MPAPAQLGDGAVAQVVRGLDPVQHRADAPCVVRALRGGQGAAHGPVQGQPKQGIGHVLLHGDDTQAAGADDAAHVRLGQTRDAA